MQQPPANRSETKLRSSYLVEKMLIIMHDIIFSSFYGTQTNAVKFIASLDTRFPGR